MGERRGQLRGSGRRFAVVVSRFNEAVTRSLLQGALDCLARCGAARDDVEVVWVPGSWEIPLAARALAGSGRFQGIVALGALIQGETSHFDVLAQSVGRALSRVGVETGVPIGFGVLTTYTMEQAVERASAEGGNKGWEAAQAAVEMADLLAALNAPPE
jgi:6,7-dimethyl-8-ribityllumazine synthase